MRPFQIVLCLNPHGFEEEPAPPCPVVVTRDGQQALVVVVPMGFEVGADVEPGRSDDAALPHEQRNKHAPQTTVAVEKRVQRFELGMQDRQLQEPVQIGAMHIPLPSGQGVGEFGCSDRHERSVFDGTATRSIQFWFLRNSPGALSWPRTPCSSTACASRNDPQGQRQPVQQLFGLPQSVTVVQYLVDVLKAGLRRWFLASLEPKHLAHRGLCALDARREYRLTGSQRRHQNVRVGHGAEQPVIARHRRPCRTDQRQEYLLVKPINGWKSGGVVVDRRHSLSKRDRDRQTRGAPPNRHAQRPRGLLPPTGRSDQQEKLPSFCGGGKSTAAGGEVASYASSSARSAAAAARRNICR